MNEDKLTCVSTAVRMGVALIWMCQRSSSSLKSVQSITMIIANPNIGIEMGGRGRIDLIDISTLRLHFLICYSLTPSD